MSTAAPPRGAPVANAKPSRMALSTVREGGVHGSDRILLVGTEGVGKTSWAAGAPSPIFLCAEDGIPKALGSIKRFPEPETFDDVLSAVRSLTVEEHEFKTLVLDTLDWIEPLVWRSVCERNGWKDSAGNPDIEKPGYGKGYTAALEEWRKLLAALDVLRRTKGMEVILLAHAAIKVFQNPAGADYARYECKLNKGAAALVKEWSDANLFAVHEEFVTEKNVEKKGKGVSTGRRVVKTERCAAWDAKNRHSLPTELPLFYDDYAAARDAGVPEAAENLIAAAGFDDKAKSEAEALIEANRGNAADLAKLVDRLKTRVAQKVSAA